MLKIKNILTIILIFIFIVLKLSTVSVAEYIPVTDSNLNSALQKFVSSEANEEDYNIIVLNNNININKDNENYVIKYDLTDKPTFSIEILIESGMSYEEFEEKTENLVLPMIGYIAVANIQGIELEDASAYILLSYLESALNEENFSDTSYVIMDDLNVSEGVIVNKTDDPNTIYTSEFGNRVIEYVNAIYKDKSEITDSEGINSYTWTTEKKDVTSTSCKLVTTLSVNIDADFSKLKGYSNSIGGSSDAEDTEDSNNDEIQQTPNNPSNEETTNNQNSQDNTNLNNNTNVDADSNLPHTGSKNTLIIYILVTAAIVIFLGINNKKYKKIKY